MAVAAVKIGLLNIRYRYWSSGWNPYGWLLKATRLWIIENFIRNAHNTQMRAAPSPTEIFRNAVMSMFLG